MEEESVPFLARGKHGDQQPAADWSPPEGEYTEEQLADLRGDKDVKFDLAHPVFSTDRVLNPAAFDKLLDDVERILSARDEKDIKDLIKDAALHKINLETIFSEYYSGRRKDPGGLKKKTAKIINNLN